MMRLFVRILNILAFTQMCASISARTQPVSSTETNFSGKLVCSNSQLPLFNRSPDKDLTIFLANLISPVKMTSQFVPFSKHLPGFPLLI